MPPKPQMPKPDKMPKGNAMPKANPMPKGTAMPKPAKPMGDMKRYALPTTGVSKPAMPKMPKRTKM